ncbi:MAG: response regulator [Pseudomonadota bacterium]|nr:response regulator [Pseudomonadota bacterium]
MENPAKIIIIDDNADFCFTMETFLKRNGFEAFSAEDGKKGLDLIQKHRPDLILLDVMMETTYSGLDVCKKVRINPELKDIPIIGISGMGDELGVHVHKWGDSEYFSVDEFYEKPVDRENLLERIKVRLKKGVVKKHKHFEG